PRSGEIDQEHHGQLALLHVLLDVGVAHARGDVPVDVPDVVAELVLPHLRELHAASLEDGVVLPARDSFTRRLVRISIRRTFLRISAGSIAHATPCRPEGVRGLRWYRAP